MFTCEVCPKSFEKESSLRGHATRMKHFVKSGLYWHVHHSILVEFCWSYDERTTNIRASKPRSERETRLKWFTPVKGKLPKSLTDAVKAHKTARKEERDAAVKVDSFRYDTDERHAAATIFNVACGAMYRTGDHLLNEMHNAYKLFDRLHAKEHVGCPWDGKQLAFPEKIRE